MCSISSSGVGHAGHHRSRFAGPQRAKKRFRREVFGHAELRGDQEAKTVELGGIFACGVLVLWTRFEGMKA